MNSSNSMHINELLSKAAEHAKQGQFDKAIVTLKELLERSPKHEIATGMLGGMYAQIGMHQRAVVFFDKALSINSNNHLALLHLGMSQIELQNTVQAVDTLKPLLALEGDFAAHYFSGIAYMRLGRNDDALAMFRQAAQTMPKDNPNYADLCSFLDKQDAS